MIDDKQIMPLNFFSYGGIYSGQHENMRYRILRTGEKPDFNIEALCWRGPYSYDAVTRDEKTASSIRNASFPFSEDGRKEAIAWLKNEYSDNESYYRDAPALLDAEISLEGIYKG